MFPDWNTDLASPTVDDRITLVYEVTIDAPLRDSRKLSLRVEPIREGGSMSERGRAVAAILRNTHASTCAFLGTLLNQSSDTAEIDDLRVKLKSLLENHRSALEYVAHYLAEKCSPVPSPRRVQFPVGDPSDDAASYSRKVSRWFPGLASQCPEVMRHLIEIQPFNTDQWLHRLSELTNFHKHRSLPTWEITAFESLILGAGDNAIRIGELGFQSVKLESGGKLIFLVGQDDCALISGPCTIDMTTTEIPTGDHRIVLERRQSQLYAVPNSPHSIAHEVWAISKNVFRTVDFICKELSCP
jgi:hypothetical protein